MGLPENRRQHATRSAARHQPGAPGGPRGQRAGAARSCPAHPDQHCRAGGLGRGVERSPAGGHLHAGHAAPVGAATGSARWQPGARSSLCPRRDGRGRQVGRTPGGALLPRHAPAAGELAKCLALWAARARSALRRQPAAASAGLHGPSGGPSHPPGPQRHQRGRPRGPLPRPSPSQAGGQGSGHEPAHTNQQGRRTRSEPGASEPQPAPADPD